MSGGGSRMAISSSVRKMIQNIKEITGNHSEDEIHAMLKECSMDPNETTQKLLLQDTFHEVKRKRDRRKENLNNKEATETRWRPGTQGRGSRGGRVNYSPRYVSHDAGSGRNSVSVKENGTNQVSDKVVTPLPTSQGTGNKETSSVESYVTTMPNGPTSVASGDSSFVHAHLSTGSGVKQPEVSSSSVDVNGLESAPPPDEANKNLTIAFGTGDSLPQPTPSSNNCLVSTTPASSSAVCFSTSDPLLVPSNDSRVSGTMATIKREVGSQQTPGESNEVLTVENKLTAGSEIGSSFTQGKMPSKAQGVGKNQLTGSSQPSSTSTHGGSLVSRPLSNYNSRSQQIIGPQKVGSNKEWKPKLTNPDVTQGSGTAGSSEVPSISVEASAQSRSALSALDSEEATSKLQRKLEELHLPQRQHVILPNHIHVPESERTKLSFGSFGACFGITTGYISAPESVKSSTPSETSQSIEEAVEERAPSQNALANAEEGDYPDHPQSPTYVPENLSSGEGDVSSSALTEYNEPKQDTALLSGGHQYSMVHTSPNYSFGFVPPMLGSQVTPFENSESQARDTSHLPSFVVQQPFDPASYYAQFYRSGADSDGRLSPFPPPGVATKYNGNVSVLPSQTSQNPQEGGNSMVLSTAGPTPLATQAAGLMQSSIAVTQQPVPVFRPPTGVHISHYPPNYIPYGHYFSPIYVPPPPIHQFLSNGAFPQQPQAGNVYPASAAAAAAGVKYSLPQYKPGTNSGNSTHIAMPSIYGPYGSSPASYNPSSAATAGNSTSSEDLGVSQFKESHVYITGQQSEGSAVWIPATGRDISNLPPSSFYNLPQSQHVTFTPTQAGHGTFAGIYHPAQAVPTATVHPLLQQSQTMAGAVDMVGPATSVYQQPQHAQINWPSNY